MHQMELCGCSKDMGGHQYMECSVAVGTVCAFDLQAFLSGINDLNFDISALDSGFNAHYLDTSNTPSQLPVELDHPCSPKPNPLGETLLPPVPSGHSDEVEENNGESKLAT
ncbi:hypothetical protein BDR07DRAFT_1382032 [Suillus spraguei]|nr:hypothetical protein BDR07DRAFT_1382032 [Suillus spraguei]